MTELGPHGDRQKVLIFMATAGGGHVAAAHAVREGVEAAGHEATVVDGLDVMSRRLKWFQVDFYAWQLEHTPWTYGMGFRILGLGWVAAAVRFLIGFFWGDRLLARIAAERPDVIVSTYPVVTAGLGRLIAQGRLAAPVVAVVTDFGVHPLWVSPQVDLHLVPCRRALELVDAAGGVGRVMTYPVGQRFRARPSRQQARKVLGLPADAVIPLIVGGAWGVGDIEGAAAAAVAAGAFPVVVAGGNEALRSRLEDRFPEPAPVRILGWTDQMPALMAAADCLIQSAGGVTCLEAMAVGLPILFVDPIPGHGVMNARIMEEAGVSWFVGGMDGLGTVLHDVVAGALRLAPPRREPGCAVTPAVLNAAPRRPQPVAGSRSWHPRPFLAAAVLVLLLWIGFSPWVMGMAAAHSPLPVVGMRESPGEVAVVVRADDPAVAATLERVIRQQHLTATLFVDAGAASGLIPDADVVFGVTPGDPKRRLARPVNRWRSVRASAAALKQTTGVTPQYILLATDRPNLVDVAMAPRHTRVVVGIDKPASAVHPGVVVVETRGLSADEAVAALVTRYVQAQAAGLQPVPLASIR